MMGFQKESPINSVDGSEIRRSRVEIWQLKSHYLQGNLKIPGG